MLATAALIGSGLAFVPAAEAAAPARVAGEAASPSHTVSYDGYSFTIDGKRTYLWSGEFHYFRLPSPDLWLDIFQKMKAAGFNSVSLYFDWDYHSAKQGEYDFSGVRDVDKLLDMAQEAGLYVIARPAPYINAEVDSGGLPGWLTTADEQNRSADPKFLTYANEWLGQIDSILARHQYTDGTGSVIAYQVENEYYNGSAAGREYMQALEKKARDDGITVPLTGNNNGTFNSGAAALDVDGPDAYPQGFNCSNPTKWSGVPDLSYDHPAGKPLYTPEFQGGAFDPWGGPGYDKCAQLINDQFANVFYKNNIAVGATAQSFYMTYGGTNWGWLGMPENYTSYDYGAAIRENRQLDPKYYEDKLIGYFTQAVEPLTKTDAIVGSKPDNPAIVDTARGNPTTGTQFHVIRHSDSTSNSVDTTHLSIDLNAGVLSYTHDDPDAALQYQGSWSHVSNQSYTGGDYKNTESFSNVAGDTLTVPFTGTAIRWIAPLANNHGYADVYLDGVKQATVSGYGASTTFQHVMFQKSGLADGDHTLKIVVDGTHEANASGNFVSVDAIDTTVPTAATYPMVPQQPGTAITLAGRDSHIIVVNYRLGQSQLQYSTSEIMTDATIGDRDVAVLYGNAGSDGETVLNFEEKPAVSSTGGTVDTTWDAATGDLRLNYEHTGLLRVTVSEPGSRPLLLLIGDKATAKTFWQAQTDDGPVLVRGTHLLRTASVHDGTLALTGDNATDAGIEVFTSANAVTWNGSKVQTQTTPTGSVSGTIPTAADVTLPALDSWTSKDESPEAAATFDDSSWTVADKMATNSITALSNPPVLYADDYGFHTGNTWYRGHFHASGQETGVHLVSDSGGGAQAFSVWLNGTFLGSSTNGTGDFTFPAGTVKTSGDNVLSVLTVNMGHEEDYSSTNGNKTARGLTTASLNGNPLTSVTWRIQGVRGGEDQIDPVRGPLATGGLYGERAGWSLPGYPNDDWTPVSLPTSSSRAGVTWYRDDVALDLPKGQDTSVGITINDDPARKYRAIIYVNGWMLGNYVNYKGPQHSFPIPNGILNPNGANTIDLAVWNLDGSTGGLGTVSLTKYGSYASSLKVGMVDSPRYDHKKYAMPKARGTAVELSTPDTVAAGTSFTASTTVKVPDDQPTITSVTGKLVVPAGWNAVATSDTSVSTVKPGKSATFTWKVTPPSGTLPRASALKTTVDYVQRGDATSSGDERIVDTVPPTPPAGTNAVSDLTFMYASNGWGPVERDTSVGENAAGDGRTITINGVTFGKGLGTNSVSDVRIYLGGKCTSFTAKVGVDDETNGAGTVTFSVVADGTALVTTPTIRGKQAASSVSASVAGAQVLDLIVGDGGDGNGNDHGDWAVPTLTCN
ncbi:beta-galactosidase [Xylanimonas sp. McL0601]|uniref:beta-galactosidase n=1 Tax=Xylanimonas sp. McL0601 TaxID=3414739 RepID=UPI003CEBA860